jgi:hypothetical protein
MSAIITFETCQPTRASLVRVLIPTPAFDTKEGGAWEPAAAASHYQLKREPLAALR